ncbi:dihydrodipicolinate synthetase family protein [Aspergillus sclerotialis]|uniref:Dihydrodipicolinate synthetase family protein n=1 Tax=Aspergillus sclerotialis TaxID=2070753 RepID=A0A3A2Z8Z4_9EURO|nr:dihydrodipicolinate synthetase family protein [Aspergillus sclerotialis]
MVDLHGIMVALITPFTDDQTAIDEHRLQALIERLIKAGVHGLVPGGSTGEFTSLTIAERKQLTELVIKYAAGRVPVIAGTGGLTTAESLELSIHAAKAGASAVMVVPPFYDAVNLTELKGLLAEIKDATGVPIVYYNIPSATGLKLSPTELASLSEIGVRYLKDTSGDGPALTELLFNLSDKITAFNGWDTLTFYGLAAGARGGIWGAANIIPELAVELWETVAVKGDLKKGRELWAKAWPICKFLESHNYAAAVKTGLEVTGIQTGGLRKPFVMLEPELQSEVKSLIQNAAR